MAFVFGVIVIVFVPVSIAVTFVPAEIPVRVEIIMPGAKLPTETKIIVDEPLGVVGLGLERVL